MPMQHITGSSFRRDVLEDARPTLLLYHSPWNPESTALLPVFEQLAERLGDELLLTGEAKHNELVEDRNLGLSVLMVGHHASEAPVLPCLAERLLALDPALKALVQMAGGECVVL